MAAMIRLVSASALRYFSGTAIADRDRHLRRVEDVEHVRQASRPRPHLLGAPQPHRDRPAPCVIAASLAAPHRPFSTGSKNAGPRGIVPSGMSATISPASSASAAACSGSSEPVPRSTRMPPIAVAIWPTIGASNTSFLPRKRTERPVRATSRAMVAGSKYDRWLPTRIAGPDGRDLLDALEVEPGEREHRRMQRTSWRPSAAPCPMTGIFCTPGGTSRWSTGQRRAIGHQRPCAGRG